MRNLIIFISGTLAAVAIFVAVYAGHHFYKEAQFRSYLKAVGLPTATGYMGGTYPKWEPMEFTYKKYKGDIPIESKEFRDAWRERAYEPGGCFYPDDLFPYNTPDEVVRSADTDPDAMYLMFWLDLAGDKAVGRQYLQKAASLGHVKANIKLAMGLGDGDKIRAAIKPYEKITPFAISEFYFYELRTDYPADYSFKEKVDFISMSNNQPYTALYIILQWTHNELAVFAIPHYDDYRCELLYRGCPVSFDSLNCSGGE